MEQANANEDKIINKVPAVASIIFGATAAAFCTAWFYYIYHYVWTGARQFNRARDIAVFICLPPILALFALAALRLRPGARVSTAVLWGSIFTSIYALEALLTFRPALLGGLPAGLEGRREIAARFGVKFDTRELIEALNDMQSQGLDAVPAVYPAALLEERPGGALQSAIRIHSGEVLPLAGVSKKLTVLCNETGEYAIYQSDELGFHNPQGLWTSGQIDIAVVGDSFAQGFCLSSEKNFVSLIRRRYPATLTLGIGGNGPLLELATVKEFLPGVKPQIVLWAYFEKNDWNELRNEARSPLLLRYLKSGFRQDLIARQRAVDQALLAYIEKEKPQALLRLRKSRDSNFFDKLAKTAKLSGLRAKLGLAANQRPSQLQDIGADEAAYRALFRAVMQNAKATVESWGGSLYFVYLPPWERYAVPGAAKNNRDEVLQIVTALKIPIIDLHAAFQSHGDPLSLFPFRSSGHYNFEGNQIVATAILQRLAGDGTLLDRSRSMKLYR